MITPLLLIILLPFISFVLCGLWGRKYFNNISGKFSAMISFITFVLAVLVANDYFFISGRVGESYVSQIPIDILWLQLTSRLSIHLGILLDSVSVMMLLIVTFISFMVHIYSIGYMKHEERLATYFSFLSLFSFSMLGLVVASNIFQTYIFWELVGVSSYLLIGFYYNKPSAVAASKKAFIVTRFADLGFLTGILILSYYSGSLQFSDIIGSLTNHSSVEAQEISSNYFLGASALTWSLSLIFIGGAGKSAMFPLHIWLPDAMEGPTPVSALIHAATMVVAGVYLVARLFPVFAISCPAALDVVLFSGLISAVIAALIACTQTDIKRILAYSTMSQIGFMMFALGISGYGNSEGAGFTASMFHLFTHAIFKALLFLCAGTVIHYVHSNEASLMGGLRKILPVTHIAFLVACLAISGIPPFSGYFSKEEILHAAYEQNKIVFYIALLTAGLTAFYMFRLFLLIFYNSDLKLSKDQKKEGSRWMLVPQIILALLAVCSGWIDFGSFVSSDGNKQISSHDLSFSVLPVLISLSGIIIAVILFRKKSIAADLITSRFSSAYSILKQKLFIDEIYLFITKRIFFGLIGSVAKWFDKVIIDGAVNTIGKASLVLSFSTSGWQSGKVQYYSIWILAGAIAIVGLSFYFL